MRQHSATDRFLLHIDAAIRAVSGSVGATRRPSPGAEVSDSGIGESQRIRSSRLMRVNHCGEVCAQALYHGQSLTARTSRVSGGLQRAAMEETDHLAWCEKRLAELDSHVSYLNPIWYAGSFVMGMGAGLMGDRISLGFVAATEEEVCNHLDRHIEALPPEDQKSRRILEVMRADEARHAAEATDAGGARFPKPVRQLMAGVSALMTRSTYWI
ncbi:MAG: 2-polyprenyl-3-methyl-6-methoxy-1,4-benzoquinone monooxygenase [Pseudomonadota bacterium]